MWKGETNLKIENPLTKQPIFLIKWSTIILLIQLFIFFLILSPSYQMNGWDSFLKSNGWSWFALPLSQRILLTYKYVVIPHIKGEANLRREKKYLHIISPHSHNIKTLNLINLSGATAQQNPKPPYLSFSPHILTQKKKPSTSTKANPFSPSLSEVRLYVIVWLWHDHMSFLLQRQQEKES